MLEPRVPRTVGVVNSATTHPAPTAPSEAPRSLDGRSTRWDAHRQARRSELVDAAVTAIRRHGAGVGMDDIARVAGTSKAVLYRHFTDKGGLYLAVCSRVADSLWHELRAVHAQADSPRELLDRGIEAYLALIEADRELYRFVMHRPLADLPDDDDPVTGLSTLIGDSIAGILAARLRAAGRSTAAAGPWAHGLVGLVRAAGDAWLGSPDRMSRADLTRHLGDLAWGGFRGVLTSPTQEDR